MITIEQVEKLRSYANVSFREAKEALEFTNGDLLEAAIYLEQQGKIGAPENQGTYRTEESSEYYRQEDQSHDESQYERRDESQYTMRAQLKKLWDGFCILVHKANTNYFVLRRRNGATTAVPVTLLILGLFFFFWIVVPLMILGLFFGWTYRFSGPDLGRETINKVMDSASKTAEDLKKTMKSEHQRHSGAAQTGEFHQNAHCDARGETKPFETASQGDRAESMNQGEVETGTNIEAEAEPKTNNKAEAEINDETEINNETK